MKNVRTSFTNKHRDSWVEINLGHLEENILNIKENIKDVEEKTLMAVIKADGYGHGSLMIAPTLIACGIKSFGVASIDEGIELRENKINCPILVLGAVPVWAFETALDYDIEVSIFNEEHLEAIKMLYERSGKKLKVQVKIDTGMNRIGIHYKNAPEFVKKIQNLEYVELKGIFTHFADAEDENVLKSQIEKFNYVLDNIDTKNLKVHCQNSLGAFIANDKRYNQIRLGIIIYGLSPLTEGIPPAVQLPELKQIISVKGRITNIHTISKGEGVSYGLTFKADKETKIATIPIGYADGISRNLSNKIQGSLKGCLINQTGRITMDQMMFDITGIDAKEGDVITILGTDGDNFLSVDNWANILGTINYELTCRLKVRLPRIYVR